MNNIYKKIVVVTVALISIICLYSCGDKSDSKYTKNEISSSLNQSNSDIDDDKSPKEEQSNSQQDTKDDQQQNSQATSTQTNENQNTKTQDTNTQTQNNNTDNKTQSTVQNESPQNQPAPQQPSTPPQPTPPSPPQNTKKCYLTIECKTILNNMENLTKGKERLVPADGYIVKKTEVVLNDNESVFDVLLRYTRENKIHMEYEFTPGFQSHYIEGINNLYEFDCGAGSGWMYYVNGVKPNYGVSKYMLNDGDNIEFRYTCDLGFDL